MLHFLQCSQYLSIINTPMFFSFHTLNSFLYSSILLLLLSNLQNVCPISFAASLSSNSSPFVDQTTYDMFSYTMQITHFLPHNFLFFLKFSELFCQHFSSALFFALQTLIFILLLTLPSQASLPSLQ